MKRIEKGKKMLGEDKVKLHDARKVIANIVGQLK
jgi:hypothetical protein